MINTTKDKSVMLYLRVHGDGGFYSYSIGIAIKGLEIELVKIFILLTSIDLSDNKFEGKIPKFIGELNSLKGLNPAHNTLSGYIPTALGNLIGLETFRAHTSMLILAFLKALEPKVHLKLNY